MADKQPEPTPLGERLRDLVRDVTLPENFAVIIGRTGTEWYLQIQCYRRDVVTGQMGLGYGGKARISEHATDSEIVQTAFGLYKSYVEHEARETFEWGGRRVFGPHIDVRALHEIAGRTDARPPVPGPAMPILLTPAECLGHHEVQHRDGRSPWCNTCGWHHGRPATAPMQVKEPR